jgi:hypothetical protein
MAPEALTVTCSYCRQATGRPLYQLDTDAGTGTGYGLFPICMGCAEEAYAAAEPLTLSLLANAARQARACGPLEAEAEGRAYDPDDLLANHDALLRLAEAVCVFTSSRDEGEEWPS